ncbi:DUF1214 domain-containing protein [Lichenihabitans sp. Uapishka_5]|uniref:DUF1214 domain-containing protein n=1 Tax=Lichenihabitans sp. Uapishka_5 TaxID=3037302 RepID=UPI0029E7E70D|nr:DUF1214 domain-containing protein [Lichenihabitans sp. Uapishka_5]MDX7952513.1 DUF1214 domain-containing protein [Lichenihabitans sp. Uapishka_5]
MNRQQPLFSIAAAPSRRSLDPSRWARGSLLTLAALGAVVLGIALGLMLTAAAVRSDAIGTRRIGPWRVFTDVGTPAIDPYLRARMALNGAVPLAAAQGLTAVAQRDSDGHGLDGRCSYRLSGTMPPAQFWTLEAANPAGRPFDNRAGRQSFASDDVLWDGSGQTVIALSPIATAGNWLPLPGSGPIAVVLRLYDTALTTGTAGREAAWPMIERLGCP